MSSLYLRGEVWWYCAYVGKKQVRVSLETVEKSEAQYKQILLDKEHAEHKTPVTASRSAIKPVIEEYLKYVSHKCVASHQKQTRRRLEAFINHSEIKRLSEIDAKAVRGFVDAVRKSDYDADQYIAIIKTFLNWCVKERLIFSNPAQYIARPKLPSSSRRFFRPDEIKRILSAAKLPANKSMYPNIMVALYTGMRLGELTNLRWSDIDWKAKRIIVENRADFSTKSSLVRAIPLHPELEAILKPLPRVKERVLSWENDSRIFKRIWKKAKITDGKPHLFRHTFCTNLFLTGTDPRTIMELMGHADLATTLKYSHTLPEYKVSAISKLNFESSKGR